jgi:hypothetical protein
MSEQDLSKVERLRIVTMAEAARLAGLSEDSLRRHYSSKIIKLSPRRDGMRLEDALMLAAPTRSRSRNRVSPELQT